MRAAAAELIQALDMAETFRVAHPSWTEMRAWIGEHVVKLQAKLTAQPTDSGIDFERQELL